MGESRRCADIFAHFLSSAFDIFMTCYYYGNISTACPDSWASGYPHERFTLLDRHDDIVSSSYISRSPDSLHCRFTPSYLLSLSLPQSYSHLFPIFFFLLLMPWVWLSLISFILLASLHTHILHIITIFNIYALLTHISPILAILHKHQSIITILYLCLMLQDSYIVIYAIYFSPYALRICTSHYRPLICNIIDYSLCYYRFHYH